MSLIRKDDLVEIVGGEWVNYPEEDRRGKVVEVRRAEGKVVVEGKNLRVRHERVRPAEGGGQTGGIIEEAAPLDISNVMFVDPVTKHPVRLGIKVKEDGTKVRVTRGRRSSKSEV